MFVHTNPFKDILQLSRQIVVPLPYPTGDTILLSRAASAGNERIFEPGYLYKKSGTMLMELQPRAQRQVTLFENGAGVGRRDRLNQAMDRINGRYGRRMVPLLVAGIEKPWSTRAANRTPAYTTDWQNLPTVS